MSKKAQKEREEVVAKQLAAMNPADLEHAILTPQEVADLRGVTRNTVIRWIRNKQIRYFRKSTSKAAFYFILRTDAEEFETPPIGSPLLLARR